MVITMAATLKGPLRYVMRAVEPEYDPTVLRWPRSARVAVMPTARARRWLVRILVAGASLTLLLACFVLWILLFSFAEPPALDREPAIVSAQGPAREADGRLRLDSSWFLRREGRSLLYVEGDPFTLGYANARLTADLLAEQERSLWEQVHEHLPGRLQRFGVYLLVLFNNRSLPDYVPREYQLEILGLSRGGDPGPSPYDRYAPLYHRVLNYHAAHDIAHWVWDRPVAGCTAFAATGRRTADGRLWVGRCFDFEAGPVFDRNKIIGCFRPSRGLAFLSVSWPGMAGAVTGINEARLYCSINGAHSADAGRIGTPVSLVVRQVLQYARTVPEALAIVRGARVFVADSYLVADGKTGEAVVVEKSPGRTGVRPMRDGLIVQANHFESPELADDGGNREYMAVGTSVARRARMQELLDRHSGQLDAPTAVAILRDTRGVGDLPLSLGNRAAINAFIATHAVVADVAGGILWVSRGPHALGAYDAYAIDRFGEQIAAPIPPDPLLGDGRYDRLLRARELLRLAGRREAGACVAPLEEAASLNPGDPEILAALGEALEAAGRTQEARDAYRAALLAHPPFVGERERLARALARLP
jgi:hypothetical protein